MKKTQKVVNYLEKAFAKTALKAGVASANSVCRFSYYQNKVPSEIKKYKK